MIDANILRSDGVSYIRIGGDLSGAGCGDAVAQVLALVPDSEHALLDLRTVSALGSPVADAVRDWAATRTVEVDVVLVCPPDTLAMELVVFGLDRIGPRAETPGRAFELLAERWGWFRHEPIPVRLAQVARLADQVVAQAA